MAQLRQDYQQFVERDTEVIVVGPEGAGAFRKYWAEQALPFTGLPDPSHSVLKQFGQEVKLFQLGRMPAQVIVDRQSVVRYAHYGNAMMDIPDNQVLFKLIDEINQQPKIGASELPGG